MFLFLIFIEKLNEHITTDNKQNEEDEEEEVEVEEEKKQNDEKSENIKICKELSCDELNVWIDLKNIETTESDDDKLKNVINNDDLNIQALSNTSLFLDSLKVDNETLSTVIFKEKGFFI